MPMFLDVHTLDDPVALHNGVQAHAPLVRAQEPHGLSYLRYWVDEAGIKIICLADAPSADGAAEVNREAHGLAAQERYPVTEGGH